MNFYTSVSLYGKSILFRGVEDGRRIQKKIEYHPTLFVRSPEESEYKTLSGASVKEIKPGTMKDAKDFLDKYKDVEHFPIYGNARFEYTFIADTYPDEINWDIKKILIAYLDIEVASDDGFPEPDVAIKEITAITVKLGSIHYVFGCGNYKPHREDVRYLKCKDEIDLIEKFLDLWTRYCPDVISGWSVKMFDVPYLVNRITRLLGEDAAKKMSPWGRFYEREVFAHNTKKQTYELVGIAILDYIDLYTKFTYVKRESYKLNHIAYVELGENKVDYSEYETLHLLYKNNFQKFIEYNIKDVTLIDRLEDKMRLIELALTLAFDNKVNFSDVFMQVRMWDAIIFNYMKKRKMVMPQPSEKSKNEQYIGAYVKAPKVGVHDWVVSFDLDSLYPHLIMQYNLSVETLIEPKDYPEELRQFLATNKITIDSLLTKDIDTSILKKYGVTLTPNGQLFRIDRQGVLAEIMEKVYQGRVEYKKKAIEAKKRLKSDPTNKESIEKEISRFNNLQLAKKINLNSAYGAIGNQYFRFFDVRVAEAVTTSGQLSARWIERKINEYMNKLLDTDIDYIIASDTDSIYLDMSGLVNKVYSVNGKVPGDPKQIIEFMDRVCEQKLKSYIEDSYKELSEYMNAREQKMHMKRETLASRGIWTAKKRYVLNAYDVEGVKYDPPEMKITGLEAIKSSTPEVCREKIKDALKIILNGTESQLHQFVSDFEEEFKSLPPEDIAFPRSVNGLSEYMDDKSIFKKGTPINTKGSLLYNNLLDKFDLTKTYEKIKEGEKIKYVYLKEENPYNCNAIAFISVLPKQLGVEDYIDYGVQFEKAFIEPLNGILSVIGWRHEKKTSLDAFFV